MTTLDLPGALRENFVDRARKIYGESGEIKALIEAVELWLAQDDQRQKERLINNQAYERMKSELEQNYPGKCIIIAHGELKGVADNFEEIKNVAPDALHRLAFRVGKLPPKEIELGWATN